MALAAPPSRLSEVAQASSDANGNAIFEFQAPPQGSIWVGSVSCQNAPPGSSFLPSVGGTQGASWVGAAGSPTIEAHAGDVLTVTATGLSRSTAYILSWVGAAYAEGLIGPSVPPPNVVAIQAGDQLDPLFQATLVGPGSFFQAFFTPKQNKVYSSLVVALNANNPVAAPTEHPLYAQVYDVSAALASNLNAPRYCAPVGQPTFSAPHSPGYQSQMPLSHEVGDNLQVAVQFDINVTQTWFLTILGSTAPPPSPFRSDGRSYPVGGRPAGLITAGGAQTFIPALSPARIHLKSLVIQGAAGGATLLEALVQNGTIVVGAAGASAVVNVELPPDGLLFDGNTAVTVPAGTPAGSGIWATYDYQA